MIKSNVKLQLPKAEIKQLYFVVNGKVAPPDKFCT